MYSLFYDLKVRQYLSEQAFKLAHLRISTHVGAQETFPGQMFYKIPTSLVLGNAKSIPF